MKKSVKKLQLSRETLHHLDLQPGWIAGGLETDATPCDLQQVGPTDGTSGGSIPTGPYYSGCPSYGAWCTNGC